MQPNDVMDYFWSFHRGFRELKVERDDWDNKNDAEQFLSGIFAAVEKYYFSNDLSYSREEAQKLVRDYGGQFVEGVKFGIELCEYAHRVEDKQYEFRDVA